MSNALFQIRLQHCHDLFKITTTLNRVGCIRAQVITQMVLQNF